MNLIPNILIADDVSENLFLIEQILKKTKANLIFANSGHEALEKIKGLELALAILDVRMPRMDGYELASKINSGKSVNYVPIIFLSAIQVNENDINKGYESGAIDYIVKPFNRHILLSKTEIFLSLFIQKQTIIRDTNLLKKSADELERVNEALKVSETRLKNIVFSISDYVWEFDENCIYTYILNNASDIYGFTHEEIIGKTPFDFMAPDEGKRVEALYSEIVANKSPIKDVKNWNICKDGKKICLLTNGVPILDNKGNLKGYRGVNKDISASIKLENDVRNQQIELSLQNEELIMQKEQLKTSTQKYANLYNFAPSGYITLSAEKEILELNTSTAKLLKKDISSLIGAHFGFFVSQKSLPDFNAFFINVFKSKTKETCELLLQINDSQQIYAHIEGLIDKSGMKCYLSIIDFTERIQAEKELLETKQFLDRIINTVPARLFWKDLNLVYQGCNTIFAQDAGFSSPTEIVGKTDFEMGWSDQAEMYRNTDKQIIESGIPKINYEEQQTTPKGNITTLITSKVALREPNGQASGILGTYIDITKRKQTELALEKSEEKYRTILNTSPDGILITDLKGLISDVSEIALELLNITREDIRDKHIFRFIPSEEKTTLSRILNKTLSEGISQNIEMKMKKSDQSVFLSEVSSTLMQEADGRPFSYMVIIRDITQRKKLDSKMNHADRMSNLGEMASGMAHEINQPLNTISLILDNILYKTNKNISIEKDYIKKKSDRIFENIDRIRNIIDHVRAFSQKRDDYIMTGFKINPSIQNAIMMISEQYKHLSINLNLQLARNLPLIIGNSITFEQVIINLLSNAKDALLEKKKSKDFDMFIQIRSFQNNQKLIIEIIDNGIGISKEDISHIMLPFYTTKDTGKGTGLGLSISYQIIKNMNGTIEILSNEFQGSTFQITLSIPNKNEYGKSA